MIIKLALATILILYITYYSYETESNRLIRLNSQLNYSVHSNLQYTPKGFINCAQLKGGLNNQLEQLWFLNILAQRTGRGIVEKPIKLIDKLGGPRVNLTEIINRSKFFNSLAVIQESDFFNECGPYIKHIELPSFKKFGEDEMEYAIRVINSTPDHICINLGFFPNYKFFSRSEFINWIPSFKELVLPNFEYSELIKSQADHFVKQNDLSVGDYISVQFRRGDFEDHCKMLYQKGYQNWAFSYAYKDKYNYNVGNWTEFKLHCYPTIHQLAQVITNYNKNLPTPAKKLLLMTNANSTELNSLKINFLQKGLEVVRFKANNELIPRDVKWTITHDLAVEMELAIRGAYLIGNRHSSIFTNLLGLRASNKSDETNVLV